jgi:hypothetical protein
MTREAVIGAVKRTDLWTFPLVAVREAIMNAIVHADYAQPGAPIRVALFDDVLKPAKDSSASFLNRASVALKIQLHRRMVCPPSNFTPGPALGKKGLSLLKRGLAEETHGLLREPS